MISGIYKITNRIDGKTYFGSSSNISKRKERHFRYLRQGIHENNHLQRAYNKYGKDAFEFKVIKYVPNSIKLIEEQKLLDKHIGKPHCYNICKTAGSPFMRGRKKSDEHRRKLSAATTRYFQEHPEARERLRSRLLGTKLSVKEREHLKKSRARGTNSGNSVLTEEQVKQIRAQYVPRIVSLRKLADKYGVDKRTVLNIVNRSTWTHI